MTTVDDPLGQTVDESKGSKKKRRTGLMSWLLCMGRDVVAVENSISCLHPDKTAFTNENHRDAALNQLTSIEGPERTLVPFSEATCAPNNTCFPDTTSQIANICVSYNNSPSPEDDTHIASGNMAVQVDSSCFPTSDAPTQVDETCFFKDSTTEVEIDYFPRSDKTTQIDESRLSCGRCTQVDATCFPFSDKFTQVEEACLSY